MWNRRFAELDEFPFRRLAALLDGVQPPGDKPLTDLSIGEPKHQPPPLLAKTVAAHSDLWNRYPPAGGTPELRRAASDWLTRRFGLEPGWLDPSHHVLPVAGTKEALFLLAAAATDPAGDDRTGSGNRLLAVLMPNPVYSVYQGAAVLAGAEAVFMPTTSATGFLPDLDALPEAELARTTVCYICTPANPQGVIADLAYLEKALRLARQYGFLLVVDECYAELYDDEPPPSALQAAAELGGSLEQLVVLHSLSKRSNAAGLRSGFIAGDPDFLRSLLRMRAYGAATQPLPIQAAAAALWNDDAHVADNRRHYRRKFDAAEAALKGLGGFYRPPGGFFLWLEVGDGVAAATDLWRHYHIKSLPGAFLTAGPVGAGANDTDDDPGARYLRLALVHEPDVLAPALQHLATYLS